MVLETKMPVKMVTERFNVGLQLPYRWIDQYETYRAEAFVGSGKLHNEDAKLKKLQKENEYFEHSIPNTRNFAQQLFPQRKGGERGRNKT